MAQISNSIPDFKPVTAQKSKASAPSFGGADPVKDAIKTVAKKLEKQVEADSFTAEGKTGTEKVKGFVNSKVKALSNLLNENQGEIQTQVLNGLFTSTLAPLVILKNPFLKKNEDDKKYAALRQPVSAALAMSTGLGMTIGINKGMNKLFDSGVLAATDGSLPISLDGRIQPSDDFVKGQLKAELAELTKGKSKEEAKAIKKEFLAKNYPLEDTAKPNIVDKVLSGFNTEKANERATNREHFKAYKKALHTKREDLFTALAGEAPDSVKINDKKELYRVNAKGETINYGKVNGFNSAQDIADHVKSHNLSNIELSTLMRDKYGFEVHTEGPLAGQIKESSMVKLKTIKAKDFLKDIGLVGDEMLFKYTDLKTGKVRTIELNDKNLNLILNMLSEEKTSKAIVESGLTKSTEVAKRVGQAIGKNTSRAIDMGVGVENLDKMSVEDLFRRVGWMSEDKSTNKMVLLEKLQQKMDKISVAIASEMDIVVNNGADGIAVKSMNAAKNITKNAIANLKGFKTFSNFAGIFFNLGVTAISCTLLNKLYPPFVALVAPGLASDKKEDSKNGGNK